MSNYNMDVFVECMVKKRISTKDIGIFVAAMVGGAVLIFLGMFIILPLTGQFAITFFIFIGVIAGVYFLIGRRNLEYEYSLTNGDVSIDKIINRKARKRITSFECKNVEEMGKYTPMAEKLKGRRVDKKVVVGAYEDGRDSVYVIVQSRKTGLTLIVFDPDEKALAAMKSFVPRHIKAEFYGR